MVEKMTHRVVQSHTFKDIGVVLLEAPIIAVPHPYTVVVRNKLDLDTEMLTFSTQIEAQDYYWKVVNSHLKILGVKSH